MKLETSLFFGLPLRKYIICRLLHLGHHSIQSYDNESGNLECRLVSYYKYFIIYEFLSFMDMLQLYVSMRLCYSALYLEKVSLGGKSISFI